MSDKLYLYPVWIRVWHLINALLFLLLILTGISMQYANVESTSFMRFDIAVKIHNVSGIILTINYLFFFICNFGTGNFKFYKIELREIRQRLFKQFNYYISGIFKNEKPPFPINSDRKFNPLQQFTYVIAVYVLIPLIFISGWGMMFPQILINRIFNVSGFFLTDMVHITVTILGTIFMIIHIYFCTIGNTFYSNFRSMINGWHEIH